MNQKKKELIDVIAFEAGCDYLSDINLSSHAEVVIHAIEAIEEEQYSLQEWKNAMRYILGKDVVVETVKQAKVAMLGKLRTG